MNLKNDVFYFINNEYYFSVLLFNVFSYLFILINFFILFFLFDLKYIKTLTDLKTFNSFSFVTTFIVILLLSFAGIPPLLGFISKFLIFILIISKNNYLFLFIFIFLNMFTIYFYIQNLRFVVSKKNKNKFFVKDNKAFINYNLIFFLSLFNFFNVFSIFYFEEFFFYLNMISSFYNF